MTGPCEFGLSLSRCPRLEQVETYKCRFLSGMNFCVLPRCKSISLHRSECTDSLEILQAPCLTHLSVQAAYSLRNLRLWDFGYRVVVDDVERLTRECEESARRIGEELKLTVEKWRNGTFGGTDAYQKGWIDREEIESFNFEHESIQWVFTDEMNDKFERKFKAAKRVVWDRFVKKISERDIIHPKEKLPVCTVDHVNMGLDLESKRQLLANARVVMEGNDDDFLDTGWPSELIQAI